MRQGRLQTAAETGAARYTFFFQVANNGQRRACSVNVAAASEAEAALLFRAKWDAIEMMAREANQLEIAEDQGVTVSMGG